MRHITVGTFAAGVIGALFMTAVLGFLKAAGIIEINIEEALGHLLAPQLSAGFMAIGFVAHLIAGGLFAFIYALVIRFLKVRSWLFGMLIATTHWVLGGIVMGQLCSSHPDMQGSMPGGDAFHTQMGLGTLFALYIVHLLYGALVGFAVLPSEGAMDSEQVIDEAIDHRNSNKATSKNLEQPAA